MSSGIWSFLTSEKVCGPISVGVGVVDDLELVSRVHRVRALEEDFLAVELHRDRRAPGAISALFGLSTGTGEPGGAERHDGTDRSRSPKTSCGHLGFLFSSDLTGGKIRIGFVARVIRKNDFVLSSRDGQRR